MLKKQNLTVLRVSTGQNKHITKKVKLPNLDQYVVTFPKRTGTGPVPKSIKKIPGLKVLCLIGVPF